VTDHGLGGAATDVVDGDVDGPLLAGRAPLRSWGALTLVCGALAAATLVAAGSELSAHDLGAAAAARGCSPTLGAGLALLAVAGLLGGLARVVADMREWHELWWDWSRLVVACLGPATVLVLSAPSMLGCRTALGVSRMPGVGNALTGAPGTALAAAAAAMVGAGLASILRVRAPAALIAARWERARQEANRPLGIVDQALARHDLLD
jgi:hypothetical protein